MNPRLSAQATYQGKYATVTAPDQKLAGFVGILFDDAAGRFSRTMKVDPQKIQHVQIQVSGYAQEVPGGKHGEARSGGISVHGSVGGSTQFGLTQKDMDQLLTQYPNWESNPTVDYTIQKDLDGQKVTFCIDNSITAMEHEFGHMLHLHILGYGFTIEKPSWVIQAIANLTECDDCQHKRDFFSFTCGLLSPSHEGVVSGGSLSDYNYFLKSLSRGCMGCAAQESGDDFALSITLTAYLIEKFGIGAIPDIFAQIDKNSTNLADVLQKLAQSSGKTYSPKTLGEIHKNFMDWMQQGYCKNHSFPSVVRSPSSTDSSQNPSASTPSPPSSNSSSHQTSIPSSSGNSVSSPSQNTFSSQRTPSEEDIKKAQKAAQTMMDSEQSMWKCMANSGMPQGNWIATLCWLNRPQSSTPPTGFSISPSENNGSFSRSCEVNLDCPVGLQCKHALCLYGREIRFPGMCACPSFE